MPKLPSLTSKQVIDILIQNGFVLKRSKGSHCIYSNPDTGKRAVIPFHNKDLPKGTLMQILKQAGIDKDDMFG